MNLKEELKNIEIGLFLYNIDKYKKDLEALVQDEEIMKSTLNQEEGKLEKIKILKEELKEANTRYQEVKDENSYYTSEKEKLQDPDYIQSYARGNYMLSKDGEQIFYLPEKDN